MVVFYVLCSSGRNTNQTAMPKIRGKIVFDKVHFRYNPQGGEVIKDKRTVMEYFLEPIIKGFGEGLKEK